MSARHPQIYYLPYLHTKGLLPLRPLVGGHREMAGHTNENYRTLSNSWISKVIQCVFIKIWCDTNNGWVRTWQFLERRWFAFSIRHAFPVRVLELQHFVATVSPTPGIGALSSTAKNDNNVEVFLPPLKFGQQRYFGSVLVPEQVENINIFIQELIWETVKEFIPPSFLDGEFNVPHPVNDVRHQDAVIYNVREIILNKHTSLEENEPDVETEESKTKPKVSKLPPKIKESEIPKKKDKAKYEIKLSGDAILAVFKKYTLFGVWAKRFIDQKRSK